MNSVFVLLSFLLINAAALPAPRQVQVGQVFTLRLGEEVQLADSLTGFTTTLKLSSLVDNRCPIDVRCIQAGEVTIKVEVGKEGVDLPVKQLQIRKTASFHLESDSTSKYSPSTVLEDGYELALLQALPYPEVESDKHATSVQLRVQPTKTN